MRRYCSKFTRRITLRRRRFITRLPKSMVRMSTVNIGTRMDSSTWFRAHSSTE